MGQIVRFEMDEPETAGVQTQQPLPVDSPINLTDEEEKMSRDSNAEIRHKAHQALDSLMHGNARFRKVLIIFLLPVCRDPGTHNLLSAYSDGCGRLHFLHPTAEAEPHLRLWQHQKNHCHRHDALSKQKVTFYAGGV